RPDAVETIARAYVETGRHCKGVVGAARCHLFDAQDIVAFGVGWLERQFGSAPHQRSCRDGRDIRTGQDDPIWQEECLMEAPRIYPTFRFRDAAAMIEWLERAFGFTTHAKYMDGDKVAHAELAFGSSMI